VHWVGNLKNVYTMMHGQKNIKLLKSLFSDMLYQSPVISVLSQSNL